MKKRRRDLRRGIRNGKGVEGEWRGSGGGEEGERRGRGGGEGRDSREVYERNKGLYYKDTVSLDLVVICLNAALRNGVFEYL